MVTDVTWLLSMLVGAGIEVKLMVVRIQPLSIIPTEQGSHLIIDPVKESRHCRKHCGFQSLHVVRQQPDISLEDPNSASTGK